MWLINQNAILTKDNLTKRKWQGDSRCKFCPEQESISHLFFDCPLAKFVWSIVALVMGAPCRPCSSDQFWSWVQIYMPGVGLFIWSVWRPFVGLFGGHVRCLFREEENQISYWDHLSGHHLFFFGQSSNRWRIVRCWQLELKLKPSRTQRYVYTHKGACSAVQEDWRSSKAGLFHPFGSQPCGAFAS